MPNLNAPSQIPVCTSSDEKEQEWEKAKDDQRPFLAVTNEEAMPGWRAVYIMDPTGEDREEWYMLSDDAVEQAEKHHQEYEQYMQNDVFIEECSNQEGALHGLSKDDAEGLARCFADIVWDTDNWEKRTPKDFFK